MFVIKVLPLSKSPGLHELSYFSKHSFETSSVISIPVRKRLLTGIVTDCIAVSEMKSDIRKSSFALKKIPEQTNVIATVPSAILQTAKVLAVKYPTSINTILYQLLPKEMRESTIATSPTDENVSSKDGYVSANIPYLIQDTLENRLVHYQNIIRSSFASNQSATIITPVVHTAEEIYSKLTAGIKQKTFLIHRNISPKKRQRLLEEYVQTNDSVLFITTPAYAYCTKPNTSAFIIDEAASTYYTARIKPHISHLTALEVFATHTGANCYMGDILPTCTQERLRREDALQSFNETPKRIILNTPIQTITINEPESKQNTFKIFAEETLLRIKKNITGGKNTFVYAGRKGLAPLIMCYDCGSIIRSQQTGNPYSLLRTYKDDVEFRWFIDTVSGQRIRASDTCSECGSWRLRERGIGIQQVEDVLKEQFPEIPVITFDGETTLSKKKTKDTLKEIESLRGGIILGTVAFIPYLNNVHLTCISSYEAFMSIPAWRADEINLRLLLQLRERTKEHVILQTRGDTSPIITIASKGLVEQFYNEEIALRKECQYPPYTTLVHFSWSGPLPEVKATENYVDTLFSEYNINFYSNPYSTTTHHFRFGLIRVPSEEWPNGQIREKILQLPPEIVVKIDPEKIF